MKLIFLEISWGAFTMTRTSGDHGSVLRDGSDFPSLEKFRRKRDPVSGDRDKFFHTPSEYTSCIKMVCLFTA